MKCRQVCFLLLFLSLSLFLFLTFFVSTKDDISPDDETVELMKTPPIKAAESGESVSTPEGEKILKKVDAQLVENKKESEFKFFAKGCAVVTSIIVKVYRDGKFVGVVLEERARPPLGISLPGGYVRFKENPEDCVRRTLTDECCITKTSNLEQFRVYSDPARDPRLHAVDICYTVRVDDPVISAGTDAKQAWICPIDKVPWGRMVFDHKMVLLDFLAHAISKDDGVRETYNLNYHAVKNDSRNNKDFDELSKQAYKPPRLFVSALVEVYDGDNFKGIALADFDKGSAEKMLPGGYVAYGECIEASFVSRIKVKHNARISDLKQFKAYSWIDGQNHNVTVVLLVRTDTASLGNLHLYPVQEIPLGQMKFNHAEILQDYIKFRDGAKINLFIDCQ